MAENDLPAGAEAASENSGDPHFQIRKLYVKDVSFESPSTPDVFTRPWTPAVELHLHTDARRMAAADYEVTITGTVTAKADEDTAFLAEIQVAGIFSITGMTDAELHPILGSYCPTILFPYLRECVSDLSVRGGFPQVVLAPVNFDVLYANRKEDDATSLDQDIPSA